MVVKAFRPVTFHMWLPPIFWYLQYHMNCKMKEVAENVGNIDGELFQKAKGDAVRSRTVALGGLRLENILYTLSCEYDCRHVCVQKRIWQYV